MSDLISLFFSFLQQLLRISIIFVETVSNCQINYLQAYGH